MKKICFVTTIPSTLRTFVLDTAIYLHENGLYDITFISNYDEDFKNKLPSYIKYIPIKMKRGISFDGLRVIKDMFKIFKKEKFDLIQYSTPNASLYASIASRISKVKVRLYCQWGIRYVGFTGIRRKIFKLIEKIICNNSTYIEPDSFGNLSFSFQEKLYNQNKSTVIWNGSANGVDLQKFDISKKEHWRDEIRKKYNLNDDIVIGFIGRLDKDKGINELLRAFKNIEKEDIKLMIVGPEDKISGLDSELYEWARNCKNIVFTGRVNDAERYYSTMDIFVLPSYREGFGSVVVEAEAMGVPVIVTNIPGPTDAMIKDKTGFIVEKANIESLQSALQKMIENSEMREKMSSEAIKFATEKFDSQELHKQILIDRKKLLEM